MELLGLNLARLGRPSLRAGLCGALATDGLGWGLHHYQLGDGLRRASYDWLIVARGERRAEEAVLIYLDEESHRQLGQPLNAPWNRGLHAQLLDRLTRAGVRAVVFDIVFS